jgi:hypothetical protein
VQTNPYTPAPNNPSVSLLTWSVPVFDADASTQKAVIYCNEDYQYDFATGTCPSVTPAPVPFGVFAQRGTDGHVTIIDNSTKLVYDYYIWKDCFLRPTPNQANWCPNAAGKGDLNGNGVGNGTTASKLSSSAGIIRTYEVEKGSIDHALSFSTANTCFDAANPNPTPSNPNKQFVYPALNTDGRNGAGNSDPTKCIKLGQRIQLDPSINFDSSTYANMPKLQKMIAKALQKYGAYNVDTAGTTGFYVEYDRTGRNVYQNAGANPAGGDYYSLKDIPWGSLKFVDPQWSSTGAKNYNWSGATIGTPTNNTTAAPSSTKNTATNTATAPAPSPTPTTTPTASAPTPPKNLIATALFDTQVILGWGASDNSPTGYNIYRNGTKIGAVPASNLGYTAQYLAASTTYKFEVSAYNSTGQESAKTALSVTTKSGCFLLICW